MPATGPGRAPERRRVRHRGSDDRTSAENVSAFLPNRSAAGFDEPLLAGTRQHPRQGQHRRCCIPVRRPDRGRTPEQLPHGAKPRQGNHGAAVTCCSRDSIRRELETRLTLEAELALAAERNEFELFYQPQLHLADGRLVGAEALIRWRHPGAWPGFAGEFMPVVNTSPISERIAEWVLETACAKAAAWERAGQKLRIGVNLSPSQLQSGDLASSVAQALARTGLEPNQPRARSHRRHPAPRRAERA